MARPAASWLTREHILLAVLALASMLVAVLVFRLALPFLPAITWAIVLAVMTAPLHNLLLRHVRLAWLAAGITVIVATVGITLPGIWLLREIAQEALGGVEFIREQIENGEMQALAERMPMLAPLQEWLDTHDLSTELATLSTQGASTLKGFLAGTLNVGVSTLVALFLLFYFLRDKAGMLAALRSLVPLAPPETDAVLANVRRTIHAIVYGRLVVATVQGALGGLMFWWLDLPAPLLWTAVMAVLGVLPVVGAGLVWLPAALYLGWQGETNGAILLGAWGALVISTVDNLLYPVLVNDKLRLHTVPVFIAVLGGISVLGATGIVLGPLILAVGMALLDVWRRRMAAGEVVEGVDRARGR